MIKVFRYKKLIKKFDDLEISKLDDIEIIFMIYTKKTKEEIYKNFKPFTHEEPMQKHLRRLGYTLQSY